jgi:hypothetical protein
VLLVCGVCVMSLSLNDHGTVHFRCDIPDGNRVVGRFDKIYFVSQSLSRHLPKLVTIVDLANENNKDLCVYFTTD